jgi:hypothetical protein
MTMIKSGMVALAAVTLLAPVPAANAEDLPCVSTTFRFIGKNGVC